MAGDIKGITIQFRGETTQLEQAIRKVNKEASSTKTELGKVNNALKFNPTSVELWRQKQTLLNKRIKDTDNALKDLKDMQKQMDAKGVDKNSDEYRELRREIVTTESKLKHFKGELRKVGNVKLKALCEQFKKVGASVTSAGKTMTTTFTAPIVAGYTLASSYASDYEENLNKIDVAFGDNSKSVKEWANNARDAYGLSRVEATASASAFGALGKGIGLTDGEAANMSTTLTGLSADLGSYFNTGTDESAKALEGIFTGEGEALKKYGVIMNETNLKKFAEEQGLVYSEMSEAEKVQLRYNYVLAKTKDAQGDFSRTNDGTANSMKIFKATLQDLLTTIGTNLLPIITPIIQKITEIIAKFGELSPRTQKIITIVGLVVAALGPLLVIVGSVISAIGTISSAMTILAGPVGIVIAVIAALIAIGILLYKNWDKIKAKAVEIKNKVVSTWNAMKAKISSIMTGIKDAISNAWNTAKHLVFSVIKTIYDKVTSRFTALKTKVASTWDGIKDAITNKIQAAKDKVTGIIDKIKGLFPIKIGNLLKNIKLPHFSLKWGSKDFGPLGTIKYPTGFNPVQWYAQGGIFDSPSVIGVGEAGSEAVVPLDRFWDKLDNLQGNNINVAITINGADRSAQEIAQEVKRILIREVKQNRLAWQ